MTKVEKIYGESKLEELLQDLKNRGIKPDTVLSDGGKYYTVIYEETNILNEG